LETSYYETYFCGGGVYETSGQGISIPKFGEWWEAKWVLDGMVYSTHGVEGEEGKCHATRVGCYRAVSNYWSQEKSK